MWQAEQSLASTGACQTLFSSSSFLKLVRTNPWASFMPSTAWQLTHRSKGSWVSRCSTEVPWGLWQLAHFAPWSMAPCFTFDRSVTALIGRWQSLHPVASSTWRSFRSLESWALWQLRQLSVAGTCLYGRRMISWNSSWQE